MALTTTLPPGELVAFVNPTFAERKATIKYANRTPKVYCFLYSRTVGMRSANLFEGIVLAADRLAWNGI